MLRVSKLPLAGWGRYPRTQSKIVRPEHIRDFHLPADEPVILRGQGRSYGDAALSSDGVVILTERMNRFLSFDSKTGIVSAEAGVTIADLIETFLPRGYFPPVTPGTKFVSLGGAFACDVHGKNHHHVGSFASHVTEIELELADGTHTICSPTMHSDLFWASAGGMGLTGAITRLNIRLMPVESAYLIAQHQQATNLAEAFTFFEDKEYDDEYSVAWIDCLSRGRQFGRGIIIRGHHLRRSELSDDSAPLLIQRKRSLTIPFDLPPFLLNPLTIRAFNTVYYLAQGRKHKPFITDYDRFFYPLDSIDHWNRMYGKPGFVQYQVALPDPSAKEGIRKILEQTVKSGLGSFLSVLKRFGPGNSGPLSFPCPGYTLAMDFRIRDNETVELIEKLNAITIEFGGRVYLAKDALLTGEAFRSMYPKFYDWLQIKQRVDPTNRIRSDLSQRLGLGVEP